ncbi:hypothetical protein [Salinimonas chungwhensis]|uniref:hypothetical protein n=1 Tax=Salinimonas chungwhensis TaxID=265425 RepID=UPI00035D629A|nr:hypothetical protein [Salinimonas chungwhensis]
MPSLRWTFSYPITTIIALMMLSDVGFVLVHLAFKLDIVSHPHFSLTRDRGYAEVFQYLKIFWIVCLLGILFIRFKALVLVAWAMIFSYMLLDDSLQIHESVGGYLVTMFDIQPAFRLRAQDFGELLVTAIAGIVLLSFLMVGYLKADKTFREISHRFLIILAGIAFFGIVVDMVHSMVPWGYQLFSIIEDGGEMFIMSLALGYSFHLLFEQRRQPVTQDTYKPT